MKSLLIGILVAISLAGCAVYASPPPPPAGVYVAPGPAVVAPGPFWWGWHGGWHGGWHRAGHWR
jgi:hypothetical protein